MRPLHVRFRRPALTLLAVLVVLTVVAAAEDEGLPAVAARPPAAAPASTPTPSWLAGLLPPGARPDGAVVAIAESGPEGASAERARAPKGDGNGDGDDWVRVEYTIDAGLEAGVRRVLEQGRVALGHVILLDPWTGAVRAYVSTAPEDFPATETYPTASLMKVVTAGAVLRHNPEAAERDCRYAGSPYTVRSSQLRPPSAGGRIDSFWRALAISNNQCFARWAVHDVGRETLLAEMEQVGLLEAPAPGHRAGRVEPVPDALALGHLGSGLAGSFITPLAAARLAAVLAHGELVTPHWIASAETSDGRPLEIPSTPPPRPAWPEPVAAELRELMVGVTDRGTARSAFRNRRGTPLLGPVRVSGKTGRLSGRDPTGRYEWFMGVAPAEAPRIAVAVVVVNGEVWWSSASQIAARVLHEVFCAEGPCRSALELGSRNGAGP